MLNVIFPRCHTRYEQSRFGAELDSFARWLVDQGHLHHPLRLHPFRVKQVLERSDCFQSGSLFREGDLQAAFLVEGPSAYMYLCTGRIFARFLAAANRLVLEEPVDPLSLLHRRYLEYLSSVRGFSAQSLKHHGSTVADFMSRGLRPGGCLADLTAADVEAYIQMKSKENKRQSLQHVVAHIRAFLRYCGDHDDAPAGLHVIDMPRVYRGESPPRALDWTLVRRLLASIRRGDPRGKRDYAILHLMAFYGLRPSEVAALRLDSIDWVTGTLTVQQRKTRSVLMLPLAEQTLRILRRYLTAARPSSDLPQLFLRVRRPNRGSQTLRNHRGLQLSGGEERPPRRRSIIVLAAACLRHAFVEARRRHQDHRRFARTSEPGSDLRLPTGRHRHAANGGLASSLRHFDAGSRS